MNKWPRQNGFYLVPAIALFFGVLAPLPASANIVESCVGVNCTVTFSFSGQAQIFTPPANAKNLSFEMAGAQGGKNGGGGGQVSGQLIEVPEQIYIFVGGAGATGGGIAGGFNGGGAAGSGSNFEGSGGGATDIRLGLDPSTRIAVAGGGGGRGGGTGSGGGTGGGLVAGSGKTAQGFGGLGGSQVSAGTGGAANGTGTAGSSGSLGIGGAGGTSTLFGGGGGGGGYFGGGGGGSDTDTCCTDAGGGGGGSSYTDAALITNVVHTAGLWPGAGRLLLRYQLAPVISEITSQVSGNQISFNIEFDDAVSGFELSDLIVNHSAGSCVSSALTGSGASYQLSVSDCDQGALSIVVNADSVSRSEVTGPIEEFESSSILIDTVGPSAYWGVPGSTQTLLEFSEPIQELELSDFEFTATDQSCSLTQLTELSPKLWEVATTGCEIGDFSIALLALSVLDQAGNSGPASTLTITFEAEIPEPPAPEVTDDTGLETESDTNQDAESETVDDQSDEIEQEVVDESEFQITPPASESVVRDEPAVPDDQDEGSDSLDQPTRQEIIRPEPAETRGDDPIESGGNTQEPNNDLDLGPSPSSQEDSLDSDPDEPAVDSDGFASPPASSLPQASQTVIIPAQGFQAGFGQNGWLVGIFSMGIFALVSGLIIARRGIPGVLSS